MANEKLRFGIVGAGGIAKAYVEAFRRSNSAELIAVADARRDAADNLAKELTRCLSFGSAEEMADSILLDGVIVCTPPSTHEPIVLEMLGRGIHVLCEKPFTIGSDSARRMLAAADDAGAFLTMASKFRYVDDVVSASELIGNGAIGDVILFENYFTSRVDMSKRWNSQPEISGGGVLIDNGTHSLDLARFFLGPLVNVQVVEGRRTQSLAVEETVRVFAKSVSGAMANIDLSWSINKDLQNYISIYGKEGTIRIGWKESMFKRIDKGDWTVFGKGYDKVQAFASQIDNFSNAVQGTESLRITGEDSLASVEAIDAAYEALRQSQWTTVGKGIVPGVSSVLSVLELDEVEQIA